MRFELSKLFKALWRSKRPRPFTPAPSVAPPLNHKVVTQWTPISHNEKHLRKTCGFVTRAGTKFMQCKRVGNHDGPCAPERAPHIREMTMEELQRAEDDMAHELFCEIDAIAQRLHREYRATSKALKGNAKHDHGWKNCRAKRYFWTRARQWRRNNTVAGQVNDNAAVSK